jgi:Activator of Hsp90 ATPase homolog 1-like protein
MRQCLGSAASSEPGGAAAASGVVRPVVGPQGISAPSVELDVRVGGRYRIEMQPLEGNRFFLLGEFREVDPPTRLAYTFRWEDPDADDRETVVVLSLRDLGESADHSEERVQDRMTRWWPPLPSAMNNDRSGTWMSPRVRPRTSQRRSPPSTIA